MQRLGLPDGELFYETTGTGKSLLLLHAGVADSRMWDSQYDAFSQRFRTARCDLRGYGRSHLPNGPIAYHEDVRALIGALHLAPTNLVGASFGGRVAVDFVLTYPTQVASLILVSPAIGGFQPVDEVARFNEQEDALLESEKLEEATELNVRMWVDGPHRAPDAVDREIRRKVGEMQLAAFSQPEPENVSLVKLEPPALERLRDIQQPTLIISGELDAPEFLRLSESLAEQIPNAERVVMPGVAHMVSLEAAEDFNQRVLAFLSSH